jgi:hypothetical protein
MPTRSFVDNRLADDAVMVPLVVPAVPAASTIVEPTAIASMKAVTLDQRGAPNNDRSLSTRRERPYPVPGRVNAWRSVWGYGVVNLRTITEPYVA